MLICAPENIFTQTHTHTHRERERERERDRGGGVPERIVSK